ncbi:MAG: helix-turn-helix domain-containing protein [Beijerinckiaceae bacterium]|jgi:DNA-binding MarR family transcriptional regulator
MIEHDAITNLILETFRLNGRLLAAGDTIVSDIGLTSARWQVLGAIGLSPAPLPVAHIARNMGLTRQAVQRLVNEMERGGLVRFAANPHHQRAKLVLLTAQGKAAYDTAMTRQEPWARSLAEGIGTQRIEAATATLRTIRRRLDNSFSQEVSDD